MKRKNHHFEQATQWFCPNCGQMYFGEHPPDICDYCHDFTTWKQIPSPIAKSPASDDDTPPVQLPLL